MEAVIAAREVVREQRRKEKYTEKAAAGDDNWDGEVSDSDSGDEGRGFELKHVKVDIATKRFIIPEYLLDLKHKYCFFFFSFDLYIYLFVSPSLLYF